MPVHEDEQAEWLEWRRGGITATEIADAWCGTYGGAYTVVARKLDLLAKVEQTAAMDRGHRWQEPIADAVHALTGLYVVGEETWCEHVDQSRHRATVDGLLAPVPDCSIDDVTDVLEVKTTGVGVRHNLDRTLVQVQWQMYVTGIPHAVIAIATIDDADDTCTGVRLVRCEADVLQQTQLAEEADRLLAHIDAGTLPEPNQPAALDTVKEVYAAAASSADAVILSDYADVVQRLHDIKHAVKTVTDEAKTLEAIVRNALGPATTGVLEGWRVSLSQPAATLTTDAEAALLAERPDLGKLVLDRDKAKAEAPELYEQHRQPVGARRLTIKPEGTNT